MEVNTLKFADFISKMEKKKEKNMLTFCIPKTGIRISPDGFLPTWPPFTGLLTWTIRAVNFHTSRAEETRQLGKFKEEYIEEIQSRKEFKEKA